MYICQLELVWNLLLVNGGELYIIMLIINTLRVVSKIPHGLLAATKKTSKTSKVSKKT